MITNPIEIDLALRAIIKRHEHHLQVRKDDSAGLEVAGTIPTMQGKQKVDVFILPVSFQSPRTAGCTSSLFIQM